MQNSSQEKQTPILIAGAGIGGLATAIALAQKGWPVVLLEKHKEVPEEGAGIQIGPNGTRILYELGVGPLLKDLITEPHSLRVMDGLSGRLLTRLPLKETIAKQYSYPYWVLHRADLHRAMSSVVKKIERIDFQTGSEVVNFECKSESVIVTLKDERQLKGCAMIAADGLWSSSRRRAFEKKTLKFTGKCAMRAVISSKEVPNDLDSTETTLWLRPSFHVVHYPVRAGQETSIVAIFNDDEENENWAGVFDTSTFAKRTILFPPTLKDLLAKPSLWRKWSLYSLNEKTPWVHERIALLGDAAHPMLPFLAQGAVMALEDAVVIADVLKDAAISEIPHRLKAYEQNRLKRTQRVQKASAQNGRVYHYDGIHRLARNLILRTLPAPFLLSRYSWLYGWTN